VIPLNKVYKRVSPAEDYYKRTMLGLEEDTSWSNMGGIKWELVLCLAAAWLIVCLSLIKGVQSSGKVVYFTALFPYLVLVILLVFGLTLDGAYDGIMFYVYPTQEKIDGLMDVSVWKAAATQIFFSLGSAVGGLITLSSYNKFNNNCHRDAIIIAFANCGTSIFAGFVIFSIVGFMAKQSNLPVEEVMTSGPGLAFIAYPEAVTKMPMSPIWSFLFFAMLITLGLDSQFTQTETITTAVMDQWPQLRNHKAKVVSGVCLLGLLLGLTLCSRAQWHNSSNRRYIVTFCTYCQIVIDTHTYQ
jgi:solute carrier family 6 amino acid transporter-like protein 5/7/9/14